jgi:hypothetical protein
MPLRVLAAQLNCVKLLLLVCLFMTSSLPLKLLVLLVLMSCRGSMERYRRSKLKHVNHASFCCLCCASAAFVVLLMPVLLPVLPMLVVLPVLLMSCRVLWRCQAAQAAVACGLVKVPSLLLMLKLIDCAAAAVYVLQGFCGGLQATQAEGQLLGIALAQHHRGLGC